MTVVALVGADGAGKTTVAREVVRRLGVPARYVYLGVNVEAAESVLPTTRAAAWWKSRKGGRRDFAIPVPRPLDRGTPLAERIVRGARSWLRTLNWLAEAWYRQLLVWQHHRRHHVVVCDRHFAVDYEVAARSPAIARDRRWSRRVHRLLLTRFYPKPDLIVVLDVPGTTAWGRKHESDPDALDERGRAYREFDHPSSSVTVVDAAQSLEAVVTDVVSVITSRVDVMASRDEPTVWPSRARPA